MSKINVEHDINIHLENRSVSRKFFVYILAMYTLVCMTKNCFGGAMADIVEKGVLTKSQTGLITAVFYIVYTPLQIVGGIVADKFSPERMIKIGLLGSALANAIIFFNHNYYVMLTVWTFNAVAQFALWPSTYKIISSQLCRSDRTYMIFFISLAASFGLIVSYVAAALVPSWEYNFAFSAAVLFLLAVILHIYDRHVNRFMRPDYEPLAQSGDGADSSGASVTSTFSLLWKSGFFVMLIAVLGYNVVSQGAKTLFPVMLVETFDKSASFGNLLNTLIIICGIAGTLILKLVLYPRFIKNEVFGMLIFSAIAFTFNLLLVVVSGLSFMVVSLCAISMTTTVLPVLSSYFNSVFTKFGKNGTAAGICNAAAAFAYAISSYVMVKIAEVSGWQAVKIAWAIMLAFTLLSLSVSLPMYIKFKKQTEKNQ